MVDATQMIEAGSSGLVMLSGGPDSVALLAGISAAIAGQPTVALHLNYGLRPESDGDQKLCEDLCDELGIELTVERAGPPEGNVQAWARDLRYSAAEALRQERDLDWIAVGHTLDDVAETVLYRLASSPGRRAFAAMAARRGSLIRPILALRRSQTRNLVSQAGLAFTDDRSNHDPAFARVRIRHEVVPPLETINPAAVTNIARTREEVLEEGALLEDLAASLLEEMLGPDGWLDSQPLLEQHPALRRIVLRQLAQLQLGRGVPVTIDLAREAFRLAGDSEGGSIDLGGGGSFEIEGGSIHAVPGSDQAGPEPPAYLELPGRCEWSGWQIEAKTLEPPFEPSAEKDSGELTEVFDRGATGGRLTIRSWQPGDRLRPLGMEGSKTVQDLFSDAKVRRSARGAWPVLLRNEQIVWVPGLAFAHDFRLGPRTQQATLIRVRPPPASVHGSRFTT